MDVIERIRNLETELAQARRQAGKELLATRMRLKLTLRQVSSRTRISPTQLHSIEKGEIGRTKTVAKVARLYERLAA